MLSTRFGGAGGYVGWPLQEGEGLVGHRPRGILAAAEVVHGEVELVGATVEEVHGLQQPEQRHHGAQRVKPWPPSPAPSRSPRRRLACLVASPD